MKSLLRLLPVTLALGCGALEDTGYRADLLGLVEGQLRSSVPRTAPVRVTLGWFGSEGTVVAVSKEQAVYAPNFPLDYRLELYRPPPDALLAEVEPGVRAASGAVVVYEDRNGDGRLNLPEEGTVPADHILAASAGLSPSDVSQSLKFLTRAPAQGRPASAELSFLGPTSATLAHLNFELRDTAFNNLLLCNRTTGVGGDLDLTCLCQSPRQLVAQIKLSTTEDSGLLEVNSADCGAAATPVDISLNGVPVPPFFEDSGYLFEVPRILIHDGANALLLKAPGTDFVPVTLQPLVLHALGPSSGATFHAGDWVDVRWSAVAREAVYDVSVRGTDASGAVVATSASTSTTGWRLKIPAGVVSEVAIAVYVSDTFDDPRGVRIFRAASVEIPIQVTP